MSPIVNNFTNFTTPDVFVREATPAASIKGSSIGVVGVPVQAIRGPVGEPTVVSSLSDYVRKFGGYDPSVKEDFMFMYNLFNNGATEVVVVRVTDSNEAKATVAQNGTTFRLKTPGSWGNGAKLTSAASSVSGYVDLTFTYGNETYKYSQVTFADANDPQYFKTIIEASPDDFVEVIVAGNTNIAVGTYTFSGGSNGTAVGMALDDTSYVGTNDANGLTGLVALEADDDVEIVVCPRANDTVNAAVLTHVSLASVSPRIAVVAPASGTIVNDVVTSMAAYNSDRLVVTYPFVQVLNPYNNKKEYHNPTAFYAGVLAQLNYHQSPSRNQLIGVIGTERALQPAEVDTLGKNRVSPIGLKKATGFVILNGINTSSIPAKANITRRRAVNYFAKTFEAGSQQFVSKPHTVQLRSDVKSAFGTLLNNELQLGRIGNVNGGKAYAVKCDEQNNTNDVVRANKMMVDVQISLLAPADFILVTIDASEAKVVNIQ
jgi:hypothetical protein